jgi:pimeloyl-ACP methyl ester carboxylesterase
MTTPTTTSNTSTFTYEPLSSRARAALEASLARGAAIDGPGDLGHLLALPPNRDGDTEIVGSTTVAHRFVDAPGDSETVRWHWVEAGPPNGEPVVMLHGIPDCWYMWRYQIDDLAQLGYRVLAADIKGYGQSDKKTGDYRHEGVSEHLLAMLDMIGVDRFNMIGHDRGAVIFDYLGGNHPERILRYIRGEQHLWHFNPDLAPQEAIFTNPETNVLMRQPAQFVRFLYAALATQPISREDTVRTVREWSRDGIGVTVPRYFLSSSFRKEWIDRRTRLIPAWNFPILLLQGRDDPFQPFEFYEMALEHVPTAALHFMDCGHYYHLELPDQTEAVIRDFLHKPLS